MWGVLIRSFGTISRTSLCILVLCGCAYALVHNGTIDKLKAESTKETIQIVRRLRFKSEINLVAMTREQVNKMLREKTPDDPTDEETRADGEAGALVGLLPSGTHLESASMQLIDNQVAAFYDFRRKEMVVIEGGLTEAIEGAMERAGMRDMIGYMILAHEYTHALQDQHFDLGASLKKLRYDTDRELALRSVCEGDATLAGWDYMLGGMDDRTMKMLETHVADATKAYTGKTNGVPAALTAAFVFPYTDGLRFVIAAYRRGGWSAVDALYRNPPQSTQQIMEPERYFDHPTLPVDIDLSGYQPLMKDWHKIEDDRYGELGLQLILQRGLGMHSPDVNLARQWAGDQMAILGKGKAITVLWIVAFRDAGSTTRFQAAYAKVLSRTPGARGAYRIDRKSNAILIVIGGGAQRFAQLEPAIWKASTIHDAAPSAQAAAKDAAHPGAAGAASASSPARR